MLSNIYSTYIKIKNRDNNVILSGTVFELQNGFKEIPLLKTVFSLRMRADHKVGIIKEPMLIPDPNKKPKR